MVFGYLLTLMLHLCYTITNAGDILEPFWVKVTIVFRLLYNLHKDGRFFQ